MSSVFSWCYENGCMEFAVTNCDHKMDGGTLWQKIKRKNWIAQ